MKLEHTTYLLAILMTALLIGGCDDDNPFDTVNPITEPVPTFSAQQVPTSERLRRIIPQAWTRLAPRLKARNLELGQPIFIRLFKQEKQLEVWIKRDDRFHLFDTWPIAHFSGKLGPKEFEGDRQAPEGFYDVPPERMNPHSSYLLSFNLGYPNSYDLAYKRTGDFLMVHGGRSSVGCYAMTDAGIAEIYTLADAALRNGQPFFRVHCFPFRMTDANIASHQDTKWRDFWKNLKQGYDLFEQTNNPPSTRVENGTYIFEPQAD